MYIYDSQEPRMEPAKVSINRCQDSENVAIHVMEFYSSGRKYEIFRKKWMSLESIILTKVVQIQKDNYHMFTLL